MQPYIHPCIEAYFHTFILVYWQTCILPYLHCCTCVLAYLHSRLLPDTCQPTSTHPRTHLSDTFRRSSKHLPSSWRVNLGKSNYFLYQKLIISRLFVQLVPSNLHKYDQIQTMVSHKRSLAQILRMGIAKRHRANQLASQRAETIFSKPVLYSGMSSLLLSKSEVDILAKHVKVTTEKLLKLDPKTPEPVVFWKGNGKFALWKCLYFYSKMHWDQDIRLFIFFSSYPFGGILDTLPLLRFQFRFFCLFTNN